MKPHIPIKIDRRMEKSHFWAKLYESPGPASKRSNKFDVQQDPYTANQRSTMYLFVDGQAVMLEICKRGPTAEKIC